MQSDVFHTAASEAIAALDLVPDAILAIIVALLAVAIALIVHRVVFGTLGRILTNRNPRLQAVVSGARGPSRLAIVLLVLALILPLAPIEPHWSAVLTRILQLAFILLLGWTALAVIYAGSDVYLSRYRLDDPGNLLARKHVTQVRILKGAITTLIVVITLAAALMTFDAVRQYGVSLFASAGVAGIIAGLAARPVLSNLFAGVQLAITQPIRLEDSVVVENEFGQVEEITATYVVVRLWDLRRLVVPLSYFIEKPFQNWTRENTALLGTVSLHADYSVPIERVREAFHDILKASPLWDGKTANLQVADSKERSVELRALVSAANAGALGDLRCEVREKLIAFLQREYPEALPRARTDIKVFASPSPPSESPAPPPSG
jgi:small-conductance mechanosensitive channel